MSAPVEALRSLYGSQYATLGAANGSSTQWAGPGCWGWVGVTATGTATRSFYDGTTLVFTVPANAAQGATYLFPVQCATSLASDGITGSPGVTVTFNGWNKYSAM